MRSLFSSAPLVAMLSLALVATGCPEPETCVGGPCTDGGPDAGPEPLPPCFIGDEEAPAELELVLRKADGTLETFGDGAVVPLMLPIQGGKVAYVGVQGRNVTCRVQLTAGFFDTCQDPQLLIGVEGRPVLLSDDGTGFAKPVNNPDDIVVSNLANVAMCPSFSASRDVDGAPLRLELRVTEERREGEDEPRVHTFGALVSAACGEPERLADCTCECDADFVLEVPQEEQCPTINDNDVPAGQCAG